MHSKYVQRLTINDHRITITYNFREAWQRQLNGHLRPPVVIKMYPDVCQDRQRLTASFAVWSQDLIFIIKEYISTVKNRFAGISFRYELVNHAITLKENREDIHYYRAELKWSNDW